MKIHNGNVDLLQVGMKVHTDYYESQDDQRIARILKVGKSDYFGSGAFIILEGVAEGAELDATWVTEILEEKEDKLEEIKKSLESLEPINYLVLK
jgi:hypothetical protein